MLNKTSYKICYFVLHEDESFSLEDVDSTVDFVSRQLARLNPILKFGVLILTFILSIFPILVHFKLFHQLEVSEGQKYLAKFKKSRVGPFSNLVKFYESLIFVKVYSKEEFFNG